MPVCNGLPRALINGQRGAVGLFGILVFGLFLSFVVLAVDTGRLALEKRRLQLVADLAALDAVQQAGLCSGESSMDLVAAQAAAQASAARNGYAGVLGQPEAVSVGTLTTVGGIRQFVPASATEASAVQVTARNQVVRSLIAGGWFGGEVVLQAAGVAQRVPEAGFWLGSFLASVDSEDATLLNGLLGSLAGTAVNLDVLSYEGLADAYVTLGELIAGAAVDGPQGLLEAEMTVADFFSLIATALDAEEGAPAAVAMNELRVAAAPLGTIRIGDLLQVATDNSEMALESDINAYALGAAALQLARQGETLSLSPAVSLPLGIGTVDLNLHIIEAPQIAIGPPGQDEEGNWKTAARTAQVNLQVDVAVPATVVLPGVTASVQLALAARAAQADAWLESIRCASLNEPEHQVTIGVLAGLPELALGRFADIADPDSAIDPMPAVQLAIDLFPLPPITIGAGLSATNQTPPGSGAEQQLEFAVTPATLPDSQTAGMPLAAALNGTTQGLASSIILDPGSLPVTIDSEALEEGLSINILNPLLGSLDEVVLEPVFRGLGLHLGGADVELFSVAPGTARLVR